MTPQQKVFELLKIFEQLEEKEQDIVLSYARSVANKEKDRRIVDLASALSAVVTSAEMNAQADGVMKITPASYNHARSVLASITKTKG